METFEIPAGTNEISPDDAKNRRIYISDENKRHFPREDCAIILSIDTKEYDVILHCDQGQAYKIDLTKEAADALELSPYSKYHVRRLDEHTFEFKKNRKEEREKPGLQQELLRRLLKA